MHLKPKKKIEKKNLINLASILSKPKMYVIQVCTSLSRTCLKRQKKLYAGTII